MAERRVANAEVAGSSPVIHLGVNVGVTQLAECQISNLDVAGSTPVAHSRRV